MKLIYEKFTGTSEENAKFQKNCVKHWSKLLESKHFTPIKSKAKKEVTAVLLNNQMKQLSETDSSIFGAQNGLSGGGLTQGDTYATGDFRLPRLLLPMVRRIYPDLMSNETVGVQPMPGPVAMAYAIRYKYLSGALKEGDSSTDHRHDGKGVPYGQKGVNTKVEAKTIGTNISITLIVGQDYPKAQYIPLDAISIRPSGSTFVAFVPNQWGYSFTAPGATADAAKTALLAALTAGMIISGVGISNPDGTAIRPNTANVGAGERYNGNDEMGYQRLDTRFTGRSDDRLAQPLAGGRFQFRPEDTGLASLVQSFEGTGAIAKTSFGFEKKAVEAGTRRLGTSWTLETEQDLKSTNGIDIESEAIQQMSYEIQAEIDREMTVRMLFTTFTNNEYSFWDGSSADARWLGERGRAFYQFIIKMSMRMQVRNRRGPANFIICTPDVSAVLQSLQEFVVMPTQTSVSTSNMATSKVGTLNSGKFTVYVDTRSAVYDTNDYGSGYEDMFDESNMTPTLPNYCMLGYKGLEAHDAGIIYCPYIPIMMQKVVDPINMSPIVGLMTRYGVIDNIFGSHLYYHTIIIDSLSQPGISEEARHLYPSGYTTPQLAQTHPFGTYAYPVNQVNYVPPVVAP